MEVIRDIGKMKAFSRRVRGEAKTLAFVPTMGALHEGHLSLLRRAKRQCDATVVSIFVNPMQFGPSEDLADYPRTLEKDLEALRPYRVDACFVPETAEVYPGGFSTTVDPGGAARRLEGSSRPGHFRGVATVVLKLFSAVSPGIAYFGQKDFQQTVVIRRMVRDFNLDVRVVVCPIVRDKDGLALSSRNNYLTPVERESGLLLSRSLRRVQQLVWEGEMNSTRAVEEMRSVLASDPGVAVDYVAIVDPESFENIERIRPGSVALVAARVGRTRLIDNTILGPEGASEEDLIDLAQGAPR